MTVADEPAAPGALLLGIDVGSSRIKALLVDAEGRDVARASAPTPFASTGTGTEASVDALLEALGRALADLGEDRRRVAGVGLAGVAESGAPLDGRGSPLAPVIAWHDRRGEDVAERLRERFDPDLGLRIGQRLRSVSTVAKLGWLLENGVTGAGRWLGVPELCLRSLTGAEATEDSLAARTGCRDIGGGSWIPEVAEAAGFSVDVFPAVAPAGAALGRVTADAATRFGLPAGAPVTVAGHDHLVGTVGSGATTEDLSNSVGTAETVLGRASRLPDVATAIDRGLAVTVFPGGAGWAVLASAARSGLVLTEAAAALGCRLDTLDALAAGADLLDAPGLSASLRQRQRPALPAGPPGAVWHTLLDHLAGLTAGAVVQVIGLLGPRRRLVVFGGGATSAPWLTAKAEQAPLPVWRMTTTEAAARGAALYAGVAAGWWPSVAAAPPATLEAV